MTRTAHIVLLIASLGFSSTAAVAQSPDDYTYVAVELATKRVQLKDGDEVYAFLTGDAAKRYASFTGREAEEEMAVRLRCHVTAHLANGFVRITDATVFPLHSTEHNANTRMVSFSADIKVADLKASQARDANKKATPQIELRTLDGVKLRAWKLIDEIGG